MPPSDDLGTRLSRTGPVRRVVSLVPSLTEALATARRDAIVGATEWCTHPPGLDVARVRGTKNPDVSKIELLAPDLVLANKEENRELDVRRLRNAGIDVWVTDIAAVPQGIRSLERVFDEALLWPRPAWLAQARDLWCGPRPPVRQQVVIPIWRDPWMVVGGATFTSDLARRAGMQNTFADRPERYPHVDLATIDAAGADVVLLPDEPYVFTAGDGPEAFSTTPTRLVSGRLLTWYGPSMIEAHRVFAGVAPDPTTTDRKR
ncbi:helical backbone metal receptor [Nocardioides endophyticus]|uniref:Helical backbone metal receptor n=1 Tax=Nocardioides endophyticus TaxID=1353775 RepID=A0ABP8Z0L0_9ACTN